MASTEEKLLTLLLSVEHLQHTAMEQQKAVADSLAVARETLRGYRDISDGVAKQVRDEVRNEVQKLDVAGLIGERISQDFQRLEESVANMKANADALNAYFHERRSLNNFHRDRVITFEQIAE